MIYLDNNQSTQDLFIPRQSAKSVSGTTDWASKEYVNGLMDAETARTESTYAKKTELSAYTPTTGFTTINGQPITNGGDITIEGTAYQGGANIKITGNTISVTGIPTTFKTINGSGITGTGNLEIEGAVYSAGTNINIDSANVISVTGITVPTKVSDLENDEHFATTGWVESQGYLTEHQSLSAYSTTAEVENMVSAATAATTGWVANQHYLTEHQSLSAYSTTEQVEGMISDVFPRMPYLDLKGNTGEDAKDVGDVLSAIFDIDDGGNPVSSIYLANTAYEWVDGIIDWVEAEINCNFTIDPYDEDGPVAYIENIPAGNYVFGLYKGESINYSAFTVHYFSKEDGEYTTADIDTTSEIWENPDFETNSYWTDKMVDNIMIGRNENYTWSFPKDVARFEIRAVDDGEGGNYIEINTTYKDYATEDTLSAYTPTSGFSTINGSAITSGGAIVIDSSASSAVTQAQYDAMVSAGTIDPDTIYVITDAPTIDIDDLASKRLQELDAAPSSPVDGDVVNFEDGVYKYVDGSGQTGFWSTTNNSPFSSNTSELGFALAFSHIPNGQQILEFRRSNNGNWKQFKMENGVINVYDNSGSTPSTAITKNGGVVRVVSLSNSSYWIEVDYRDNYIGFYKNDSTQLQNLWDGITSGSHYEKISIPEPLPFINADYYGIPRWNQRGEVIGLQQSINTKTLYFNTTGSSSSYRWDLFYGSNGNTPARMFVPTTSGIQGQVLTSAGNAEPTWQTMIKAVKISSNDYDALVQAGTTDENTLYLIVD